MLALLVVACTNNPYSRQDSARKIFYTRFSEPPKTLDPQVAYAVTDHDVIGNVYEGLLQYHYLKRPYELIPALAEALPETKTDADGHVHYRFRIHPDARYHPDPCFEAYGAAGDTRTVTAADFAFVFARVADPLVESPVISSFEKIVGFTAFTEKLKSLREADPKFASLPPHEQYAKVGPIEGVRVLGELELELVLSEAYPQMLYWLAMPFTAAVPWEAVAYYDGVVRPHFREHEVGAGPFRLTTYEKQYRMVLVRHEGWYGALHPEWRAPGTVYPAEGASGDAEKGFLAPGRVGQALPVLDEIAFYREKEAIPSFGKFLQGYYDASSIVKESFDTVVRGDHLSPDMEARGMRLANSVDPDIYYIGFNMKDAVVGQPAGERGRKLRQAMSLAIDTREYLRLFRNGRGVLAQSPLPPGIYGYREEYRNPYRQLDLERAKKLLGEAGYPGGIDPATGQALKLGYDTGSTDVQTLLQDQFFVNSWRKIGIDVEIRATTYNQFQEKMRKGGQQIFQWGWVADYPDPENFMFLLESSNGRLASGGPNDTNFSDPRFDQLFKAMKVRANDAERQRLIDEMVALIQEECPWIGLFHRELYALYQPWLSPVKPFGMSFPMLKYYDVDPQQRTELRAEWNKPRKWPAYALASLSFLILAPGVFTYMRERS